MSELATHPLDEVMFDQPNPTLIPTRAGRYLTFTLGTEQFGLHILRVREIISLIEITRLPCASPHIRGVINLRGQVISVVDLRHRFNMPPSSTPDAACIIVTEVHRITTNTDDAPTQPAITHVGIVVDSVSEVLTLTESNIEDPPDLGDADGSRFILGMGKVGTAVKILIDIDQVISGISLPSAA